jgi:hypothetical protein
MAPDRPSRNPPQAPTTPRHGHGDAVASWPAWPGPAPLPRWRWWTSWTWTPTTRSTPREPICFAGWVGTARPRPPTSVRPPWHRPTPSGTSSASVAEGHAECLLCPGPVRSPVPDPAAVCRRHQADPGRARRVGRPGWSHGHRGRPVGPDHLGHRPRQERQQSQQPHNRGRLHLPRAVPGSREALLAARRSTPPRDHYEVAPSLPWIGGPPPCYPPSSQLAPHRSCSSYGLSMKGGQGSMGDRPG